MAFYNWCWPGDSHDAGMPTCGPRWPCCHHPWGIMGFLHATHLVVWRNKQNNRRQGNCQIYLKATSSWWDPWLHASSKNNIKASSINWSESTDFDFKQKLLPVTRYSVEEKTKRRASQIKKKMVAESCVTNIMNLKANPRSNRTYFYKCWIIFQRSWLLSTRLNEIITDNSEFERRVKFWI